MILKDKLLKNVVQSNEIGDEELEVIAYGMEILFQKIIFFIGAIIISLIMNAFTEGIVFMILFTILRQSAGGVHMNSKITCAASSAAIFIMSIVLIQLAIKNAEVYNVLFCLALVGTIALLTIAPVDTPNKRITKIQKKKNSLKVKLILLGFYSVLLCSFLINFHQLCCVIVVVVVVESILVIVGKILLISRNI